MCIPGTYFLYEQYCVCFGKAHVFLMDTSVCLCAIHISPAKPGNTSVFVPNIIFSQPFPKQALVFTCLQYKFFENTVEKREIARNEQFLPFPQRFLPV